MATTIQTDLRHHQWAIVSEVLKPRQIGVQALLSFQVNIEADEIEEREFQIFGGRIVNITEETFGIFCFRSAVNGFEKALNTARATPTHDRSGDFVAYRVAENRRVTRALTDGGAHTIFNVSYQLVVIKKGDMLLPGQSHHDPQSALPRKIEKPARRHCVRPQRVNAIGGHLRKILRGDLRIAVLPSVFVRTKWSVSYAANVKLPLANEDELSACSRTAVFGR